MWSIIFDIIIIYKYDILCLFNYEKARNILFLSSITEKIMSLLKIRKKLEKNVKNFSGLEIIAVKDHLDAIEIVLEKRGGHSGLLLKPPVRIESLGVDEFDVIVTSEYENKLRFVSKISYQMTEGVWKSINFFLNVEGVGEKSSYTIFFLADGSLLFQQSYRAKTNLPGFIHGTSFSDRRLISQQEHHQLLSMRKK